MEIYYSIDRFRLASRQNVIATLGTFDGVHLGHRKIIDRLTERAASEKCESLILTFFPHPRMVLQDAAEIRLLNTIDEKIALLAQTALNNLIIHPFDDAFSRLTAEEFVSDILVSSFNIKKIIIGHDHRFGRNRTASIKELRAFGEKYGFEVEQIDAEEINAVSVSSTKIRNALLEGNIELANSYLGYEYLITGIVEEGKKIGRTIGFPTANISIPETYKLIPANGVYIVTSLIAGEEIHGLMNIGTNPTVGGTSLSIEVHFFDFDRSIYGETISISVRHRIRDEIKFDSLDMLKNAIAKDRIESISWIDNNKL